MTSGGTPYPNAFFVLLSINKLAKRMNFSTTKITTINTKTLIIKSAG